MLKKGYKMIINMLKGFEEDEEPLPLIISTTDNVYAPCFIVCEDETHLSIVVIDMEGHEFGKILNKDYIVSVEVFYEEMINVEEEDEQKMYH